MSLTVTVAELLKFIYRILARGEEDKTGRIVFFVPCFRGVYSHVVEAPSRYVHAFAVIIQKGLSRYFGVVGLDPLQILSKAFFPRIQISH